MQTVSTIGLDIAKSVFQVHGVDAEGNVVIRRQLKRRYVLAFFEKLPSCLVGIEACASSHHWSRELRALGHNVRLMPPAYVRMNLRATYDRDFPGSAGGRRHIECFGSPMTGRFCLWRRNSRCGWRINGDVTVSVGRSPVVIRIGDNHYSMMMPTAMAKGVVAKMAARYRATAMLDGECAGDGLTCTEHQSQNQSQNQNRSDCLATH